MRAFTCLLVVVASGCHPAPARPQTPTAPIRTRVQDGWTAPDPTNTAFVPRAPLIQCPHHSLGGQVWLVDDRYRGIARDNYEDAELTRCTYSREEIRCEGEWSFQHSPAALRIVMGEDGRLSAELTRSAGTVEVFGCVAPEEDLGNCVFNPQTPGCPPQLRE
jgi:hypothetical protein